MQTLSPAPSVRLELDAASSLVLVHAAGVLREHSLPLGTSEVARLFRSDPPRPTELEHAIDIIEEAVMPLAKLLPPGSVLRAGDELTRRVIARSLRDHGTGVAEIAAVEGLFDQLARAALRGTWAGSIPMDANLSAAVVIVREFMHHTGFQSVRLPETD